MAFDNTLQAVSDETGQLHIGSNPLKPLDGPELTKTPSITIAEIPPPPITYPLSGTNPALQLEDRGIDEVRSLRVVVIGAGLTGVLAGILLPVKVPKIDLVIYEKNADVVGENEILRSFPQQDIQLICPL